MTNYAADHWHTHKLKCAQCQDAYDKERARDMCGTGMVYLLAAYVTRSLWRDERGVEMGAEINSWHTRRRAS